MFVFPEPLGPTMAVTPPSNWISVCRAKVLKPSNCRDLRNNGAGRVPDGAPSAQCGHGALNVCKEPPISEFLRAPIAHFALTGCVGAGPKSRQGRSVQV